MCEKWAVFIVMLLKYGMKTHASLSSILVQNSCFDAYVLNHVTWESVKGNECTHELMNECARNRFKFYIRICFVGGNIDMIMLDNLANKDCLFLQRQTLKYFQLCHT
jgi:hypothetical protein